jgi:hypothetical protein
MVDMMPREAYNIEFVRMAENKLGSGTDNLFTKVYGKDKMVSRATPANSEIMSTGQVD